jgi:hypothetical protein
MRPGPGTKSIFGWWVEGEEAPAPSATAAGEAQGEAPQPQTQVWASAGHNPLLVGPFARLDLGVRKDLLIVLMLGKAAHAWRLCW